MDIKLNNKVIYLGKAMKVTDLDLNCIPNKVELKDINLVSYVVTEYESDELKTLDDYKKSQMITLVIIFTLSLLTYTVLESLVSLMGLVFMIFILKNTLKTIREYYEL